LPEQSENVNNFNRETLHNKSEKMVQDMSVFCDINDQLIPFQM